MHKIAVLGDIHLQATEIRGRGNTILNDKLESIRDFVSYCLDTKNIKAYLVSMGDDYKGYMLEILKLFRDSGISCDINYTSRSIKAEIKKAEKLDFDIIAFLGEDEYKNDSVTIKDLKNFKQYKVSKNEIVGKIFEIAGRM